MPLVEACLSHTKTMFSSHPKDIRVWRTIDIFERAVDKNADNTVYPSDPCISSKNIQKCTMAGAIPCAHNVSYIAVAPLLSFDVSIALAYSRTEDGHY